MRKVEHINGNSKSSEEIKNLISASSEPLVFTNMLCDWQASQWCIETFLRLFGSIITRIKLCKKRSRFSRKRKCDEEYVMDTDCEYVDCSVKQFTSWMTQQENNDVGPLKSFKWEDYTGYSDYNYMTDFFKDYPSALHAINWGMFGYPERNGAQSTIWYGSAHAYTPCHQDAYGTNLVAQLAGVKKWTLLSPKMSGSVSATRIPYEESSIFCTTNIKTLRDDSHQVLLQPGEVLYVPKHWWHFVESETNSLSVNTWLEHATDGYDRIQESLVKLLVVPIKTLEGTPTNEWLNPKEELSETLNSCLELVNAAWQDYAWCNEKSDALTDDVKRKDPSPDINTTLDRHNKSCAYLEHSESHAAKEKRIDGNFLIDCFADRDVLQKVVAVMRKKYAKMH